MRLGSLKSKRSRDGELVVINSTLSLYASAKAIAGSLREALEDWPNCEVKLKALSLDLESGKITGEKYEEEKFESALPRTWLFADGSAFVHHIKLVRQARKAALPETLYTVPLMYQAEAGRFLASTEDIPMTDFAHGTDFEAEVGVIVDDVPMGVTATQALQHIKLVVLINDVSLRGLIPEELAAGFGFFQSKPNKSLSPVAVTTDELGEVWKDGRLHLPILVNYNGQKFGTPNAGVMHFHFGELIAHAARTRPLAAGTLIGSGTVSNEDTAMGCGCLAEKRMLEQIHDGKISTSFMKDQDTIEISMLDQNGRNLFGRIHQKVQAK